MQPDALTALVRTALPGAAVTVRPPLDGSQNRHAEAVLPDGTALFVKVYGERDKHHAEGAVVAALCARYDWPVAAVGEGVVGDGEAGVGWRAFPLLDLAPVEPSPALLAVWAERLADVHRCPAPNGLDTNVRAVDQVERRLARLRAVADTPVLAVADRAAARWDAVRDTIGAEAAAYETPYRLLTNDFGFRNTCVRPDGAVALYDFERSGPGDPHWDLGKAWDRELADPAYRAAFLAAYRAAMPDAGDWPHPATLWVTRFAGAMAAIPYALRVGADGFVRESVDLLTRLETEAP
jgi:aminoglycoside phosphotransferase (APT) family kinase protein